MSSKTGTKPIGLAEILAAVFFVALMVQISQHIMWRDELRTWQIVRESSGFGSVVHDMRFDAVPPLWNWVVFILTRLSSSPFLMQLAHACIATGTVYVVARWAPFPKIAKILFAFGYFPFFEYAVISRNYALVFLFVSIACVLISQKQLRPWALAWVLFLLSQVSVWGIGLAGLLLLVAIARMLEQRKSNQIAWDTIAAAISLVFVGMVLSYICALPGPGRSFTDAWRDTPMLDRVPRTLGSIYRAWIPVPEISSHFWNTNILNPYWAIQAILGIALLAAVALSLARRPIALALLLCGAMALLAFNLLSFKGSTRHEGHLFIVLIAACWIATAERARRVNLGPLNRMADYLDDNRDTGLLGLLGINVIAGIGAAIGGLMVPFSATKATADYIRANYDDRVVVAAYTDYCAAPISQWLNRPIFSIEMSSDIRYNTQDDAQRNERADVLGIAYLLAAERHKDVLLVLNSGVSITGDAPVIVLPPMENHPHPQIQMTYLPHFDKGVVQDESQNLYLMHVLE